MKGCYIETSGCVRHTLFPSLCHENTVRCAMSGCYYQYSYACFKAISVVDIPWQPIADLGVLGCTQICFKEHN